MMKRNTGGNRETQREYSMEKGNPLNYFFPKVISHLFILLPFHQEVTLPVPAIYPSALKCILRMPLPLMQHIVGNHISQTPLPSGFHIGLAYGRCQQKLGRWTRGGGQQHLLHRCSSFQRAPRSLCDPIPTPTNIHPAAAEGWWWGDIFPWLEI